MRVAIIGTRYPQDWQFKLVEEMAYKLANKGVEVSSGGAIGIDTAAETGVKKCNPSKMYLYLSENVRKINRKDCNITIYDKRIHSEWNNSVRMYHPSRGNLSPYAFALHARNFGIVADPIVDAVIALPKSISDWGGTGQGMRIAISKGIKLFNLLEPGAIEEVEQWIRSLPCPLCNNYGGWMDGEGPLAEPITCPICFGEDYK